MPSLIPTLRVAIAHLKLLLPLVLPNEVLDKLQLAVDSRCVFVNHRNVCLNERVKVECERERPRSTSEIHYKHKAEKLQDLCGILVWENLVFIPQFNLQG